MSIQLGLVPADFLLVALDLLLKLLNSVLVMVYFFLVVLCCLLPQFGQLVLLLNNQRERMKALMLKS